MLLRSVDQACRRLCVLALAAFALTVTGCDSFELLTLISGSGSSQIGGGALEISPLSATLSVGTRCTFAASGGGPPYRFSVASGGGAVDPETGVYTAPLAPSTAVVRVTDAQGAIAEATVDTVQ